MCRQFLPPLLAQTPALARVVVLGTLAFGHTQSGVTQSYHNIIPSLELSLLLPFISHFGLNLPVPDAQHLEMWIVPHSHANMATASEL
jgi:hypothetical protein